MKTYLLTLGYDGTDFCGWQRQKELPTVQKAAEDALYKLTGQIVSVTASGRTDEGVHAVGQTASFACDTTIPAERFPDALNPLLPPSVRVTACREVPDSFCARRSAKQKTYAYRLYRSDVPLPHMERYALRVTEPLDGELWSKACKHIEGRHDFRAFYCLGSSAKTTVRNIYSCSFARFPAQGLTPETYEFRICGEGFLYKMVRLLVGALLRLQDGKLPYDDFVAALGGDDTRVRKVPAPAKGLTLVSVAYEE